VCFIVVRKELVFCAVESRDDVALLVIGGRQYCYSLDLKMHKKWVICPPIVGWDFPHNE
jgi:hypothetical protein